MKVTGYKIKEALKLWTSRRDMAAKQFNDSIWQFEDDNLGLSPQDISAMFAKADDAVAQLQSLQQYYNTQVEFEVAGQPMTLTYAVKKVGGAARMEKMWKTAAEDTGVDRGRWSTRELSRNVDSVHATRMVTTKEAVRISEKAAHEASLLRTAIAVANGVEKEIGETTIFDNVDW
jgi:hypothetical protein